MKSLLVVVALLLGHLSFAEVRSYPLPSDAKYLTPIIGSVESTASVCPDRVYCIRGGFYINLKFTLMGCVDELAPVQHIYSASEQKLYISAINIHRKSSDLVDCLVAKTETRRFEVQSLKDLQIIYMGTNIIETLDQRN